MIKLWSLLTNKKIILPFYHVISEHSPVHIKHLYQTKTPDDFCRDIDFLLKHYEPVDAETLFRHKMGLSVTGKPIFHLTFDDGLKEMAEVVAPILLKKGIPATFFVNSGFVDNKDLFYRYHMSLAVEQLMTQQQADVATVAKLKSVSYLTRNKLYEYYSSEQVNDFLLKEKPYLTTMQIKELHTQGFTIGAHSIDHPYYNDIPLQEQIRQTLQSVDFVNTVVPQNIKLFAFPFSDYGVKKEFFEKVEPLVNLTFGTAGIKDDEVRFNIQRVPVEESTTSLKKILQKEYMMYIFKRLLGKNVVQH